MIRIPDVPAMQGQAINAPQASPVQVSAAAAAAPAHALGSVAQAIAGVGEHFQGVADQAQKIENARMESEARQQMADDYANLQLDLQKDFDPASRIEKTRQFFTASQGIAANPDLPPAVRESLVAHHNDFATQGMIRAGQDAAELTHKRAGLALQNEMAKHLQNGDAGAVDAALGRAQAAGIILPEQAESLKRDAATKLANRSMLLDIQANPSAWIASHPLEKIPAGFDPVSWGTMHEHAKGMVRQHTYEDSQTILDGIAGGQITRPEQIDQLAPHLGAAARETMKGRLLQKNDEAFKAKAATPEYQAGVVGQVSAALRSYSPSAEGFDNDYARMAAAIDTLPQGAVRAELDRQIKQARDGKLGEVKTHADAAVKTLDAFEAAGGFGQPLGKAEPVMATQQAINDGFITDKSKLLALGFDEEQAKNIIAGVGADKARPKTVTATAQENAFKTLWVQRKNPKAKPDPLVAQTAAAIVSGQSHVAGDDSGRQAEIIQRRMEIDRRYGAAKTELLNWLQLNPKSTAAEIDDKVMGLGGAAARDLQRTGGFFPPKTVFPETSMNEPASGDRITSYGYSADSTPDSNSTAGIGAWVGDAEAAKIKAGENTPNKLRAGDLAVSRDVEQRLRAAGVNPGDPIKVKLDDGSFVQGRWMDRTAETFNGKTLTGRFDVYSPNGKHALDGRRIVGWSRETA